MPASVLPVRSSPRLPVFLLTLLFAACRQDVTQLVFHPAVDNRVSECLSGAVPWPGPVSADTGRLRFAVLTDPHFGDPDTIPLGWFRSQLGSTGASFVVVLGDITDNGFAAEYVCARQALNTLGLPCYCTIGNHDLYQADGWQNFKATFGPGCYSVAIADRLKLVFLDTADGTLGRIQSDWLAATLESDSSDCTIILTHYPLYDGVNPTPFRLASPTERYRLQWLLARYRVKAFVAGHIHGWRHTRIDNVDHFIAGALAPGGLDYGTRGFLLFELAHDGLRWSHVEYPEP